MQPGIPTPTQAQGHQGPDSAGTPASADARYTQILDDLITMGAALARRVQQAAMADTTPPAAAAEATVAFDRISRCVRRCIALARHVAANPAPATPVPAHARTQARIRLIRRVEDAIVCQERVDSASPELSASLRAELTERLEDPALEFDFGHRPLDEIITDIIEDLGLARQGRAYVHQRRTPAAIHALRQEAANPPPPTGPAHLPPWPPDARRSAT